MSAWEYKRVHYKDVKSDMTEKALDKLGADRWELVLSTAWGGRSKAYAFFRRPKR